MQLVCLAPRWERLGDTLDNRCSVADPNRADDVVRYATLAQVGLEMVAPIGVGLLLDYQLDTLPWITVAGAVIGFAGGLYHLVAILNRKKQP